MIEQLQDLLDMLAKTPEMAVWGVVIYLSFLLIKMASWIGALTMVTKQFIKRYFDYRDKKIAADENMATMGRWEKILDKELIGDASAIVPLLAEIGDGNYIHNSDIKEATRILKEHKVKKISA